MARRAVKKMEMESMEDMELDLEDPTAEVEIDNGEEDEDEDEMDDSNFMGDEEEMTSESQVSKVPRLTGRNLLQKLQEIFDRTDEEKALACGYVKPNGSPNITALRKAVLKASGINLYGQSGRKRRQLHVNSKGIVHIAPSYTEEAGFQPKDPIRVIVDPQNERIIITKDTTLAKS